MATDIRPGPPARYKIAEWWEENDETAYPEHQCGRDSLDSPPYYWPFVIDVGEPSCFACHWYDPRVRTYDSHTGYTGLRRIWDDSRLERAHIIPHSLGGSNHVSNYLLLCARCHREAPDTPNPRFILQWALRRQGYGEMKHAELKIVANDLGVDIERVCQVLEDHETPACRRDISRGCIPHFGSGVSLASVVAATLVHAEQCDRKEGAWMEDLCKKYPDTVIRPTR